MDQKREETRERAEERRDNAFGQPGMQQKNGSLKDAVENELAQKSE